MQYNLPVPVTEYPSSRLTDVQTGKRIHEHLLNPYDVITEEDIRNVVTSIGDEAEIAGS